jgi:hypothetical protein
MKVLDIFMGYMRKKRPVLVEQGWFFHWDNAPVHTAAIIQIGSPPSASRSYATCLINPNLVPVDFLFRT